MLRKSKVNKGEFSSAFSSYDKKTDMFDQSLYGPFDSFSFNDRSNSTSVNEILGNSKFIKNVPGSKKNNIQPTPDLKKKLDSDHKNTKYNKNSDTDFGKDKHSSKYKQNENDNKPKKEIKTVVKDGTITFIDEEEQDEHGNMKSIDAGAEYTKEKKKKKKGKSGGFQSMELHPQLFQGIMKMGFKVPTPIQRRSIPSLLEGHDVVAMARTGSGKTAAFCIPLLQKLSVESKYNHRNVRAVVLSPTRELAQQTWKVVSQLGRFLNLKIVMLVGGQSMHQQFEMLSQHPDVIIATPGRLVHHLVEVKFSLLDVEFCCFDEADRLFEMGFAQQLYEILKRMGEQRQTCLFSATMPKALIEFSRAGLKDPISIRLDSESKISPDLAISFFCTRSQDKLAALSYLLTNILPEDQQAIIFASTKHHVELITQLLNIADQPSVCVYGDLDSEARSHNIEKFKKKFVRCLVVTDVAARGIDIPLLDNVINYDFPSKAKLFIHRAGRVARNGMKGTAYSLVAPEDMPYLIDLYLFFAWKMPLLAHIDQKKNINVDEVQRELEEAKKVLESAGLENENKPVINEEFEGLVVEEVNDDEENEEDAEDKEIDDNLERTIEIGRFPTTLIDQEIESVNHIITHNDLERMYESVGLAFTKYLKNRESASTIASKKWKLCISPPIHPAILRAHEKQSSETGNVQLMGMGKESVDLQAYDDALANISNFTPDQTIFELINHGTDIMALKRREHDYVIRKRKADSALGGVADNEADSDDEVSVTQVSGAALVLALAQKRANNHTTEANTKMTASERRQRKKLEDQLKSGVIKSREELEAKWSEMRSEGEAKRRKLVADGEKAKKENYMSLVRENVNQAEVAGLSINAGTRMEDLSLDLDGEDADGTRKAKKVEKWNARKKKFVTTYEKKDVFGKNMLNEAGQKIKDTPSGALYETWQRKHKKHAVMEGNDEFEKDTRSIIKMDSKNKTGSNKVRSELRSTDEVMRERKMREVNRVRHAKKDKSGKPIFNKKKK